MDTISFSGSFAGDSLVFRRQMSICSVHAGNTKGLDRLASGSKQAEATSENIVQLEHRWNSSFHHFRFVVVFLAGLAVGLMSLLRLSITVAIINMVNQTKVYLEEKPNGDLEEYFGQDYQETGEFEWDNEIQQLIISYYMIAYTLPQLYTTKLAIRAGIRFSIAVSIMICAASCALTPPLAYFGWQYITLLRLVNGLGASAILPIMVHVIELWMPAHESALGLAIAQFVQALVFTLSPLLSGYLAAIHWKWAFYAPAGLSLVFCLVWLVLVSDQPSSSCLVSEQELRLIYGCSEIISFSHGHCNKAPVDCTLNSQPTLPWTRALRLKSFYAIALVWCFYCSSFGSFSFLSPSYMRQVLKVPIMENGMLCFMIQAGCMFSVIWPQPILRLLQSKCKFSLTVSRRLVLSLICIVAIITWLLVAKYHQFQVALFSVNRIFHLSTDTIVTATIMSQYSNVGIASEVYSAINAIGNLSTVFFCMISGYLLDITGQSNQCWSWIFIVMSIMNVATILLYSTIINSEALTFEELSANKSDQLECSTETGTIKISSKCVDNNYIM